mgnify:CR=1 FL=1
MGSWSYDVASDLVRFRRSKIMLCEQVLGKLHDFDTTGKTIEYVDIEWHEAFKKIHKKTTDKGTEVGIRMDDSILSRGLYQDDVIYADDEKLFAEAEKKLLAAYEIGDTKPAEEPLVYDRVTA